MAETMAKHMLILKDSSVEEILQFLEKAEAAGQNIPTTIGPQIEAASGVDGESEGPQTVAYEARQLRVLFLKLSNS